MIVKYKVDNKHFVYRKGGVKISEEEALAIGGIVDYKDTDEAKAKAKVNAEWEKWGKGRAGPDGYDAIGEQLGDLYHMLKDKYPKARFITQQAKVKRRFKK